MERALLMMSRNMKLCYRSETVNTRCRRPKYARKGIFPSTVLVEVDGQGAGFTRNHLRVRRSWPSFTLKVTSPLSQVTSLQGISCKAGD